MTKSRTLALAVLAVAGFTCTWLIAPLRASAIAPTVTGAGSTWVQIALDQWRADIARQGYTINYQGVGSSAGRQFFIINQVDFAASEIPFYPSELQQLDGEHKSFQYLPDVAGGTSLMYNLHTPSGARITTLRLDATTAAKIFTGGISSWHDPAIQALNPSLQISESNVIPVIRSDGSGTSAQFSLYLANQASAVWSAFVANPNYNCPAPCSQWPPFPGSIQQNGSDGVANFLANDAVGAGAIGYVEAGYAFGRGFPITSLRNASGHFTPEANSPTAFSRDVATALQHATLNADLTQNLSAVYNAPEADAYAMSSYSYLITQTAGFDPAKGSVLGTWLIYIACAGQQEATPLGYSPLPPNLVSAVFAAEQRLPGAPAPPPIDGRHCPNPTLTGSTSITGGSGVRGGASNAITATVSAGATASLGSAVSGGLTGLAGAAAGPDTAVPTLSGAQRRASFLLAEATALDAPAASPVLLLLAGAAVILAVFAPAMFMRRRDP